MIQILTKLNDSTTSPKQNELESINGQIKKYKTKKEVWMVGIRKVFLNLENVRIPIPFLPL